MKALNVSSTHFVFSIVNLVEKNLSICKSAACSVDQLKAEQIDNLTKLMEIQQKQIDSVKKTVKTEMKSWAVIVQKTAARTSRQLRNMSKRPFVP